ncbi:MAG: histidinol dehydrogenase [Planctomycetaceae bacterium]
MRPTRWWRGGDYPVGAMTDRPPLCERIDLAAADGRRRLDALRGMLVSQGDVISPAGRQKTIDVFGEPLAPRQVVERICADVRRDGLAALLDYSRRIDGAATTPESLLVPAAELAAAHRDADPEFLAAVRRIRDRVERFQRALLARDVAVKLPGGGSLRQRYVPLDRVGVCVPGGAAAYPSTLLMTVVPARVAGVREIVVVAPPTRFGAENPHVLATCHELGVTTVVRVGGAQAVAALAYGVEGLPRVDKIVGPGNLFVALAKEHVYGDVSIDSIAGPSEIVVVADDAGRPECIAADMLAQAEHSPGSAILLTASRVLADAVAVALERRLAVLERADLTRDSLRRFCGIVTTRSDAESADLAHDLAPEHLSIDTRLRCCDSCPSFFLKQTDLESHRTACTAFIQPPSRLDPRWNTLYMICPTSRYPDLDSLITASPDSDPSTLFPTVNSWFNDFASNGATTASPNPQP